MRHFAEAQRKKSIHPEIYDIMVDYISQNELKVNTSFGATYHIMIDDLEKVYPEYFSIRGWNDLEFTYGKNFMGDTFKKAVIDVYGKEFLKEWSFLNSRDSLRKIYPNPQFFFYDENGKIQHYR